jgi:hypothetical protein
MFALTVLEPWASGIIHGTKRIENRTWQTHYRGPLAIHAGISKKLHSGVDASLPLLQRLLPGLQSLAELRHGKLLGVVEVVDCVRYEDLAEPNEWAEGPWCWVLANPRALPEPIPCKGKLSLWALPEHLAAEFRLTLLGG